MILTNIYIIRYYIQTCENIFYSKILGIIKPKSFVGTPSG